MTTWKWSGVDLPPLDGNLDTLMRGVGDTPFSDVILSSLGEAELETATAGAETGESGGTQVRLTHQAGFSNAWGWLIGADAGTGATNFSFRFYVRFSGTPTANNSFVCGRNGSTNTTIWHLRRDTNRRITIIGPGGGAASSTSTVELGNNTSYRVEGVFNGTVLECRFFTRTGTTQLFSLSATIAAASPYIYFGIRGHTGNTHPTQRYDDMEVRDTAEWIGRWTPAPETRITAYDTGAEKRATLTVMRSGDEVPARFQRISPGYKVTTFGVFGDFGMTKPESTYVANLVKRPKPDYIMSLGDQVYGDVVTAVGSSGAYDYAVGKHFPNYLKGVPSGTYNPTNGTAAVNRFFPCAGNHDYTDVGISWYNAYFPLPYTDHTAVSATGSRLNYDVVLGDAHFFVIDSYACLQSTTTLNSQRDWMQAAVAASTSIWKIAIIHDPPYSSGDEHGSYTEFRFPFSTWGVDMVLSGSHHAYERVQTGGVTYITQGNGSAAKYGWTTPVTGSQVRYNLQDGAGLMTVTPTSIRYQSYAINNVTVDDFTLNK